MSLSIYRVALFITQVMITNSKTADKIVSNFVILVSHSRPKYIGNMKWETKIING
jgi:hypothetical protein